MLIARLLVKQGARVLGVCRQPRRVRLKALILQADQIEVDIHAAFDATQVREACVARHGVQKQAARARVVVRLVAAGIPVPRQQLLGDDADDLLGQRVLIRSPQVVRGWRHPVQIERERVTARRKVIAGVRCQPDRAAQPTNPTPASNMADDEASGTVAT